MNEININDKLNEINIYDEIDKAFVRFVNALREGLDPAIVSIQDMVNGLEPYQRYEFLHPQKKPRGSIRRAKKERNRYDSRRNYSR